MEESDNQKAIGRHWVCCKFIWVIYAYLRTVSFLFSIGKINELINQLNLKIMLRKRVI